MSPSTSSSASAQGGAAQTQGAAAAVGASAGEAAPRRTIRLAHLLDGRHFGGAEQMVRRLMLASPAFGIDARAYILSEGRLAEFLRADGLALRVFASSGRFDLRMLGAMARAARADGLDVLQAHTSRTHLIARLLSSRLGIPNITTIQSPIALDENRGYGAHPWRAWVERLGRRWTDRIVPVSHEETERLAREEGVAAAKLAWIPNGVEALDEGEVAARRAAARQRWAALGLVPEAFTAVMVAQLRPRKGPEVLLRAAAAASEVQLLIIGDDEFMGGSGYLSELRSLAESLGLGRRVVFAGFQAEPWLLAAGADLMALPSLFGEGLPLVLLEAMNHGLPLAVSDTAGNRELVRMGDCGWLHAPGDAAGLADALDSALRDPALTRARGEAGRGLFLRQFALDRVMARWRSLYENLLDAEESA